MDEETTVEFRGAGPFWLPAAQSATASCEGETVSMTLYVLLPDRQGERAPIQVQMTHGVARQLSESLLEASTKAELNRSRS